MRSAGIRIASLLVAAAASVTGCQTEEASTAKIERPLAAASIGMSISTLDGSATVFDADTNAILGTVLSQGPPPQAAGDCSITPDGTKAFYTRFDGTITVVDLSGPTPTLGGPPNPIPIANPGEDTSLSPDGKFLLVCDGSALAPVSVIDVATQTQIGTFDTGADCNSVEVCSDGSVLVTSFGLNTVRRLTLSATGALTDTGESLAVSGPMNTYCGPSAKAAVIVEFFAADVKSFTIPGLAQVSTVPLGTSPVAGALNHAGDRFYVRSDSGSLSALTFDQTTAVLGNTPVFSVSVAQIQSFFGIDQLAVHPSDATIYVPEPSALRILNAATGATVGSINSDAFGAPTGVCFTPGPIGNRPPVAKCAARTVPADGTCHAATSIDDGSFDPDPGDQLECTQTPPGPFDRGATSVTLTCTDAAGLSSSCSALVTVADQTGPALSCPADQSVECNNGQGGAAVSFTATATDNCAASSSVVCSRPSGSTFGLGTNVDHCRAADPDGNTSLCDHHITVVDTAPPTVSPAAVPELWPPFHDYRVIDLADCVASLQDTCQGSLDVDTHAQITCCTSDEPDVGLGDGDLPNDCVPLNNHAVRVRAERGASGNGRVYTLHYLVTDGANKTVNHTCKVGVPHQRTEGPAIDSGPVAGCR